MTMQDDDRNCDGACSAPEFDFNSKCQDCGREYSNDPAEIARCLKNDGFIQNQDGSWELPMRN